MGWETDLIAFADSLYSNDIIDKSYLLDTLPNEDIFLSILLLDKDKMKCWWSYLAEI